MSWTYAVVSAQEAGPALWGQGISALNAITNPAELMSVKIGSCDSPGYGPRTTIFYLAGATEIPDPAALGTTWSYQAFSNAYSGDDLWQEVADFLNSQADGLTDTQKFWSQVSMTALDSAPAHVALWYRNQD